MKGDPARDLGARLFEAARTEPLPSGAEERALTAAQRGAASVDGSRFSPRSALTLGLTAAALAAAMVLFVGRGEPTNGIRAEPASSMHVERAAQSHYGAAPADSASSASIAAAVPSAAGASRVAPSHPVRASLTDELGALKRAESALSSGDAHAALAALDQYDRVLKGHALRAEATLLRIEALSRSGQAESASALAEQFVSNNPGSPLVDRARSFVTHQ